MPENVHAGWELPGRLWWRQFLSGLQGHLWAVIVFCRLTGKAVWLLLGIQAGYTALFNSPSGTLPGFTDSANKLGNDFKSAAQELKAGLPKELSEEFQTASIKYKELRDL